MLVGQDFSPAVLVAQDLSLAPDRMFTDERRVRSAPSRPSSVPQRARQLGDALIAGINSDQLGRTKVLRYESRAVGQDLSPAEKGARFASGAA